MSTNYFTGDFLFKFMAKCVCMCCLRAPMSGYRETVAHVGIPHFDIPHIPAQSPIPGEGP